MRLRPSQSAATRRPSRQRPAIAALCVLAALLVVYLWRSLASCAREVSAGQHAAASLGELAFAMSHMVAAALDKRRSPELVDTFRDAFAGLPDARIASAKASARAALGALRQAGAEEGRHEKALARIEDAIDRLVEGWQEDGAKLADEYRALVDKNNEALRAQSRKVVDAVAKELKRAGLGALAELDSDVSEARASAEDAGVGSQRGPPPVEEEENEEEGEVKPKPSAKPRADGQKKHKTSAKPKAKAKDDEDEDEDDGDPAVEDEID
jgi:hypothetical protein